MKIFFLFSFILNLSFSFGQTALFLTPTEKAYLFHTIRKSPILEHNIGRYVAYSGEEITFSNGELNYDSIGQIIINNPELLQIYMEDIRRSPKGILSELTNKTALWELNKVLLSFRNNNLEKDGFIADYEAFENEVLAHLPEKAIKIKSGKRKMQKRIETLSNPSLTFKDKAAILEGMGDWTNEEKKQTIHAFNKAINTWVSERSFELFQKLGGEADFFLNILTAAGDGSSTSGLLDEREKDEKGRWNKGLPKAVGLFPYEPKIGINPITNAKKTELLPTNYTVHQFETVGNDKETNIHIDVWGYNSEKQTTVVIKKSGKYYPLFGSIDSRFLSPDSAFGDGMTYYSLLNKIQKEIDELEEKISGKKGLDYRIDDYEKKKEEKERAIEYLTEEIDQLRRSQYNVNPKELATDNRRHKKRKEKQEKVVLYFGEIKRYKNKISELNTEKEKVLTEKGNKEYKKREMLDLIGENWTTFTEKDGLYLFSDSTRFDLMTQEFTFPAKEEKEIVEVILLAMPISASSNQYDEVMLHINVTDARPMYTSQIQIEKNDLFAVNQYSLSGNKFFSAKDSIAVLEFFEALLDKKKAFKILAQGGVGKWKNDRVVIDYFPTELENYPGNSAENRQIAKESKAFKGLRKTELSVLIDRNIVMEINAFTDPIRTDFKPIENKKINDLMQQYQWSGNQVLSAYRVHATLTEFQKELAILASEYLIPEKASKIIDRFNKEIGKTKISIGKNSVLWKDF